MLSITGELTANTAAVGMLDGLLHSPTALNIAIAIVLRFAFHFIDKKLSKKEK